MGGRLVIDKSFVNGYRIYPNEQITDKVIIIVVH